MSEQQWRAAALITLSILFPLYERLGRFIFCFLMNFLCVARQQALIVLITLFSRLTRYPFNDSEHASLFAKISRGIYVVPDCLSSKARCIIRALLRRDPDERITSEDVLYHPWLKQDDEYREVINTKSNPSSSDDQCVPEWYRNECDAQVPSDVGSQYDMM